MTFSATRPSERAAPPEPPFMQTCDVLVVGAGIAGASAAFELAPYARVVLLERERQPGYHSTGRSAAVFAPAYGNRAIRALTAASQRFYQDRLGGLAEQAVLLPRGILFIGRADQEVALARLAADTAPQIVGLERLDGAQVLARLPALRPDYVTGGIYDPSTADLDVAAIHQAYLKGFRARGGQLVLDAELTHVATDCAPWRIETRAGPFEAAVLVNAAGAWADALAGLAGVPPLGLVPKRRTAFVFEPSSTVERHWPLVIDVDEQFYFKPESGLLLGSPADETPVPPADVQPEELDIALAIDRIERAARFRVLRVVRRWAGLRTFAPDKTPVVGMEETVPGFFWLVGQGGYGIQTAPALARAAASLLVDGVLPDDLLARGLVAEDFLPLRFRLASRPAAPGPAQR
jgi:D-arginine dehydrogenase